MFSLKHAGSFDTESVTQRQLAVKWATRRYGLTAKERRGMCSCLACRAGQEEREQVRAAFWEEIDLRRTNLLNPPKMFNSQKGMFDANWRR